MNPYESPVFSDVGVHDWSLAKRCAFWFSMLLIGGLFINSVSLWKSGIGGVYARGQENSAEKVMRFVFDWRPRSKS